MTDTLQQRFRETLDALPVPPAAPDLAVARGRRLRRRRTAVLGSGVAAAIAGAVALGGVVLDDQRTPSPGYSSVGALDFSNGLRAYASPSEVVTEADGTETGRGGELHLGGRTFPMGEMDHLDTDAAATSRGLVFFDPDHRPYLLAESGDSFPLAREPAKAPKGWRPSAQADSTVPRVALTQPSDDGIRVVVVDLDARRVVAGKEVSCEEGDCNGVRVDAYDNGTVFVRTPEGTRMWTDDDWALVSGPETRIADARGGVLLYDDSAPPPHAPGWRAVAAPIDAQLTFDGRYVLDWSSTMRPTIEGADPVVLQEGPRSQDDGRAWWAVDTDGSVLVAVEDSRATEDTPARSTVYDCEVPSGRCTELGPLSTEYGDPLFIGTDM